MTRRKKRSDAGDLRGSAGNSFLSSEKAREVKAVFCFAFALYLALALLTRLGGPAGARLGSFLSLWFGNGAYLLIFLPLLAGIFFLDSSRQASWLDWIWLFSGFLSMSLLVVLLQGYGNLMVLTRPLFRSFGNGGTLIIIGTFFLVTTLLLTRVSLTHFGKVGKIVLLALSKFFRWLLPAQSSPESLKREYEPGVAVSSVLRDTEEPATGLLPVAPEISSGNQEEPEEEFTVEVHLDKATTIQSRKEIPLELMPVPPKKRKKGEVRDGYRLPGIALLEEAEPVRDQGPRIEPSDYSRLLEETLRSFGVEASVLHMERGPTVTRYELQPAKGVKVSKILSLSDDIALALAATSLRIEAPIPGKSAIGIEIPNSSVAMVYLKDLLSTKYYQENSLKMILALGKDIAGQPVFTDMKRMPHLLIAGATGSGKTVCINTLIASILFKATPAEVQFLMIDPKRVELTIYDGIPHLIQEVVTDPKQAAKVLIDTLAIMDRRYSFFKEARVRNIEEYNRVRAEAPLPYIIVLIDELADLMMLAAAAVETSISRLAALARAAGMHLIVATQRPSVDVITGIIKANIPSRVAFAVSSMADSRTILDTGGAEKLLGRGDMLFAPIDAMKPVRLQGAFVSLNEIESLVRFWQEQPLPENLERLPETAEIPEEEEDSDADELYSQAKEIILRTGYASVSTLQRKLKIGYARAGRLMDILEERGIVGPADGAKPRKVLVPGSHRSPTHELS